MAYRLFPPHMIVPPNEVLRVIRIWGLFLLEVLYWFWFALRFYEKQYKGGCQSSIVSATVESRDALGIEDYRKESCIPILYMF